MSAGLRKACSIEKVEESFLFAHNHCSNSGACKEFEAQDLLAKVQEDRTSLSSYCAYCYPLQLANFDAERKSLADFLANFRFDALSEMHCSCVTIAFTGFCWSYLRQIRTADLISLKDALYLLSYSSEWRPGDSTLDLRRDRPAFNQLNFMAVYARCRVTLTQQINYSTYNVCCKSFLAGAERFELLDTAVLETAALPGAERFSCGGPSGTRTRDRSFLSRLL